MSYSIYATEGCDAFAKSQRYSTLEAAEPQKPIPGAVTRLRCQLNEAHEAFASLRARLDPVLESSAPMPATIAGGASKAERGPACEHHGQLVELNSMAEELICNIRSVASRLAL